MLFENFKLLKGNKIDFSPFATNNQTYKVKSIKYPYWILFNVIYICIALKLLVGSRNVFDVANRNRENRLGSAIINCVMSYVHSET